MGLRTDFPDFELVERSLGAALASRDHDATAPIRAGMRARAIADACEDRGLAIVMLDRAGCVLHVSAATTAAFGAGLSVVAGHLVGDTPALDDLIQKGVAQAVGAAPAVFESDDDNALSIVGVACRDPSPLQLLRGILVLGRAVTGPYAALAALRDALAACAPGAGRSCA